VPPVGEVEDERHRDDNDGELQSGHFAPLRHALPEARAQLPPLGRLHPEDRRFPQPARWAQLAGLRKKYDALSALSQMGQRKSSCSTHARNCHDGP
jgi:hypothetical protein